MIQRLARNRVGLKLLLLFISIILFSGCASQHMVQVQPLGPPDSRHAMVTFIRPSMFGGAIQFGIWDRENLVGVLSAGAYIQYLTTPGEHLFMARAENWSYVKATLQAGRNYYIMANVFPGIWKARVALAPVKANDPITNEQINSWMHSLRPTAFIEAKRQNYVQPRIPHIRKAIGNFNSGNAQYLLLMPGDYR